MLQKLNWEQLLKLCVSDNLFVMRCNGQREWETRRNKAWLALVKPSPSFADSHALPAVGVRTSVNRWISSLSPVNRYQWTGNAGTHFWHAHTGLQKLDGLHGSVVVRQPPSRDPNSHLYDFDLTTHVMLLADWMHEDAAERYPGRLAVNTGQDPESMLINGKGQFRDPNTGFMTNTPLEIFTMTPGRRYRFRMINAFSTVCPAQITIEGRYISVYRQARILIICAPFRRSRADSDCYRWRASPSSQRQHNHFILGYVGR